MEGQSRTYSLIEISFERKFLYEFLAMVNSLQTADEYGNVLSFGFTEFEPGKAYLTCTCTSPDPEPLVIARG